MATVEQDTDDANAEQIAVLVLTRLGERELVGGFGISDPTFAGIRPTEVVAGIAAFGPPADILDISDEPIDNQTLAVDIRFT